jgi:hypothetical protein
MALQLSYTDEYGVDHPESYWKVSDINIDMLGYRATLTLKGWHTVGSMAFSHIEHKAYLVEQQEFTDFMASLNSESILNLETICDVYAMTKDFFSTATQV